MVSETKPLLAEDAPIPPAPFARALATTASTPTSSSSPPSSSSKLPQAIAHRGYKALYPENTLLAFRGALDAGAHALETDLHLSRDGVVVLSHDGTLKRCFGVDARIQDCDWEYLRTLRTTREPPQPMPRLEDLLAFLGEEGREKVWVLLDIKTDDPAPELLGRVAQVLASTPGPVPWEKRIIFGCWSQPYIDHCRTHLPAYPLALISWSPLYARKFLAQPAVSFNIFQKSLVGPLGRSFIRDLRAAGRRLFVWTVNDEEWMEWSIRAAADGVITDDPELFLDVCRRWEGKELPSAAASGAVTKAGDAGGNGPVTGRRAAARPPRRGRGWRRTLGLYLEVVGIQVLVAVFTPLLMLLARFGVVGPGPKTQKALRL